MYDVYIFHPQVPCPQEYDQEEKKKKLVMIISVYDQMILYVFHCTRE